MKISSHISYQHTMSLRCRCNYYTYWSTVPLAPCLSSLNWRFWLKLFHGKLITHFMPTRCLKEVKRAQDGGFEIRLFLSLLSLFELLEHLGAILVKYNPHISDHSNFSHLFRVVQCQITVIPSEKHDHLFICMSSIWQTCLKRVF